MVDDRRDPDETSPTLRRKSDQKIQEGIDISASNHDELVAIRTELSGFRKDIGGMHMEIGGVKSRVDGLEVGQREHRELLTQGALRMRAMASDISSVKGELPAIGRDLSHVRDHVDALKDWWAGCKRTALRIFTGISIAVGSAGLIWAAVAIIHAIGKP